MSHDKDNHAENVTPVTLKLKRTKYLNQHQPNSTQKEKKKMVVKQHFTTEQAKEIGDRLEIDWHLFDVEQFRMGLDIELEHGLSDPSTNVTDDDSILTGKIALAHLNEFTDYYTRLKKMEREAEEQHGQN